MYPTSSRAVLGIALMLLPAPLLAANRLFTATEVHSNPPASPVGRCAPASLTVNIGPGFGPATGTSDFGGFVPTESHCIVLPLPAAYSDGRFSFAFTGGDDLRGTYFGTLSGSATPGTFTNVQRFTVTGGTGRFAGASGSLLGTGNVVFAAGRPPAATIDIAGTLALPAVPEPAAWSLLIAGFALTGTMMRQRRVIVVAA